MAWALYAVGWSLGWLLLWSTHPLPAGRAGRPAIAVVVPARDEAASLPHLLGPLGAQLQTGDELVVVDDGSTDSTAAIAAAAGARVVEAPPLPRGWVGKPHACWTGARHTAAPVLVFLDADVRPGRALLDGLTAALDDEPRAVVSVQPWHDAPRPAEQATVLANVVALMGSGAFSVLRPAGRAGVAFGAVLAVRRDVYEACGGHASPDVRGSLVEDIALARRIGRTSLHTGREAATFRMYPGGLRQSLAGWSRTMAAGIGAARWWTRVGRRRHGSGRWPAVRSSVGWRTRSARSRSPCSSIAPGEVRCSPACSTRSPWSP